MKSEVICPAISVPSDPARLHAAAEKKMALAKRVLIVDDNMDAADLTAEVLRMFGLSVEVAYGGHEGLSAAIASEPDVIFLDIGMPFMDGYEVAKAVRLEVALTNVKLVALTAWGDALSREKSRAAGFDLHLTKPAKIAELVDIAR
jgi:CheY-like chemotaxis protein